MQARIRSNNGVIPLVQREEDEKFRSVFITRADSGINTLADLKGKTFTFGSPSSTSGYLMPRSFLMQAKVDSDKDFRQVAYSGAHDATIAAVAGGKVQAGALNISAWEKFVNEKKVDAPQVRVFYTTLPYYDYKWTVGASLDSELRDGIAKAFLDLSPNTTEGKEIIELQRATRFVPTKLGNYVSIGCTRGRRCDRNAGDVGAGGLVQLLYVHLSWFQMQRVATMVIAMVLLVDLVSYFACQRLTR